MLLLPGLGAKCQLSAEIETSNQYQYLPRDRCCLAPPSKDLLAQAEAVNGGDTLKTKCDQASSGTGYTV